MKRRRSVSLIHLLNVLGLASLGLLLAFALCPASAEAQCWGGSCGAGSAPSFVPYYAPVFRPASEPVYSWRAIPGAPTQFALMRDGRQIGAWCVKYRYYRAIEGGEWGPSRKSPPNYAPALPAVQNGCAAGCSCTECEESCPCRSGGRACGGSGCSCIVGAAGAQNHQVEQAKEGPPKLFGVDRDHWKQDGPRYVLHGQHGSRTISREQALQAVESEIPDDSGKLRLVVIGQTPDRQRVLDGTAGLSTPVRDRLLVQAYEPANPLVKERKLVTDGAPTVYLLSPRGTVLGRNLSGRWEAGMVGAVEQLVADYDPARDPDLVPKPPEPKKPDPVKPDEPKKPAPFTLDQIPGWAWGALITGALALLLFRVQQGVKK